MAFVLILTILALVLFWFMPLGVAIAGAVVAAMLVVAKLREAAHHGRLVIAARKKDESAEAVIQDTHRRDAMFYAMWIGLTVSGSGHHHGSDSYVHGQHGGDYGGDHGGGFGDAGGGGDAGGV